MCMRTNQISGFRCVRSHNEERKNRMQQRVAWSLSAVLFSAALIVFNNLPVFAGQPQQASVTEDNAPAGSAVPDPAPSPAAVPRQTPPAAVPSSPLQFRIGDATITPVGFMDLTNTFRSTNSGASLAT